MSFGRRNTDWQAWGQHRRRATARIAQKTESAKSKNIRRVLDGLLRRRRRKNDLVCCRIGGVGAAGDLA